MPKLTVNGRTFDVNEDKRLVLAIEENGIPIGHRCGGNARCTTCRVKFEEGEPDTMTKAEYDKLVQRGMLGEVRLSCQIKCDHDMVVEPLMTAENQPQWEGNTGPAPKPEVAPEPKWYPIEELKEKTI